jgi:uncharacterized repeat protein (TIGR01451 family)
MFSHNPLQKSFYFLLFLVGITVVFSIESASHTLAQSGAGFVRLVRTFEIEESNLSRPAGLVYIPESNAFHVVEARQPGHPLPAETELARLTPFNERAGSARIAAAIENPINLAFDGQHGRLLIFQAAAGQLIEVLVDSDGSLQPAAVIRHNVRHFGLPAAQGLAVDPGSGALFVLDAADLRIVRIAPEADGNFAGAEISRVDLRSTGLVDPSGLAFDPTSGHLHVVDRADQNLYELSQSGQVLAVRDLSTFKIGDPQGMVFAPTGDLTDDPGQMSLYLADSGLVDRRSSGQILELSFVEPASAAASTYESTLIQTIEAWQWSPPNPDSSGVTYLPDSNTLLVSDGEVNELPIFTGDNMFQATLDGTLTNTFSTLLYSTEPTGVTVNPANAHLFVSDDNALAIHEVNPGPDGLYDTQDDTVTSFLTSDIGSNDPEEVAFDPAGALFIVDGLNREVYRVTPGANAIFDGVPPAGDDLVTSFDTARLGLYDPEGIAFNPDLNHLYVIGKPEDMLFEVTTGGDLIQTIDVSAANQIKPAGLAYAPNSQNPSGWNIYIADRGVDSDNDPNQNDGKIYELTLPLPPGGNVSPVAAADSASTSINASVVINVAANDGDPNGNLDPTTANTTCPNGSAGCAGPASGTLVNHADGAFTYTPDKFFTGNDLFVYEICDISGLCDTSEVQIAVYGRQIVYISADREGTVGGVAFSDEDILAFDTVTGSWSIYFDGSDVGLDPEGEEIDAIDINQDGSILLSLEDSDTIPGIGNVDDWDIVRFIPTETGDNTAGSFELYFDGEDMELSTSEEDIDALDFAPDGRLVISTRGSNQVGGISGEDEDLLIFTATSLGANTSGTWELYFDGSDVGLGASSEDVSGAWLDPNGDIYLTTLGDFAVTDVSGDGSDIFICQPISTGENTNCSFSMFLDGLAYEFEDQIISAIFIGTEADLFVDKVDTVDPVMVGQMVAYIVTVSNYGSDEAMDVVLVDTLPAGVSFGSAAPDQGTCSHAGGVVTCDLLELASGDSLEVIITVKTTKPGVITNNVSIAWDDKEKNAYLEKTSESTLISLFRMYLPTIQSN